MCPIVGYEYFLPVVDYHAIGKLEMFRAPKFIQNVSHLVENYNSHDLTFHDNYSTFVIYANATWML